MPLASTRLEWYPRLLALAAAVGFAFVVTRDGGAGVGSGLVSGDYAAFYSAGRIVLAGDTGGLYSYERQRREQLAVIANRPNVGVLPFVYPPYVAVAFAPLALLPYRASYVLYTLLMVAAVVVGTRRLRAVLPALDRAGGWAAVSIVGFFPMFVPIVGGQNTPIGFLCATSALAALIEGRDRRAGVWLGVWLFKPHFALPVIGLFLVGRRLRALAGVGIVAAVYFLASLPFGGLLWPLGWWRNIAQQFVVSEFSDQSHQLVSWLGFAQVGLGGVTPAANGAGLVLSLASIAWLVWMWWTRSRERPAECMAAAVAGALLISPHTMWYDVGLAVLPLAVVAALGSRRERLAVAGLWLWALVSMLPSWHPALHPFFVVTAGTFALVAFRLTTHARVQ